MDDTDVATRANVEPVYDLLHELGFRTTKTVWGVDCPEGSRNFSSSETLEDEEYAEFVQELAERGFEIAFHGATMESSPRARTLEALERLKGMFGAVPRVHANHAFNQENLYWGVERLDSPLLRLVYRFTNGQPPGYYQGHDESSDFWWGDVAREQIEYCRNLSFETINLCRVNPTMPYRDPRRPLVPWWFSASDAEDCAAFNSLVSEQNQELLEREGGVCIVATHLGKLFAQDGEVHAETRRLLQLLSSRQGWFVPVGELLDWLRTRTAVEELPRTEWSRMQWSWFVDLVHRRLRG